MTINQINIYYTYLGNIGNMYNNLNNIFFIQPHHDAITGSPGVLRQGYQGPNGPNVMFQRMNTAACVQNTIPSTHANAMNTFGMPSQIRTPSGLSIQKATVMTGKKVLLADILANISFSNS